MTGPEHAQWKWTLPASAMLATLAGLLALPLGLTVLLLPLLAPELSRPRDSAWGAVVLLLGLDLVTSAERLTGAPMLGVLCGALLIGRLGLELGQGRWRQLTEEERLRLGSMERWSTSFRQLGITSAGLVERAGTGFGNLTTGWGRITTGWSGLPGAGVGERMPTAAGQGGGAPARSGGKRKGKRWVRPETSADSAAPPGSQDAARPDALGSFAAAPPAPEAAEGPRPAPEATGPAPESAAPHGVAEPAFPLPPEGPDPATQSSSSRERGSRA